MFVSVAVCSDLHLPCVVLVRSGTLVELRQQIAVERAMRTRLRAEMQEMDARIAMTQLSVADARRSDTSSEQEDRSGELAHGGELEWPTSERVGGAGTIRTSSFT